MINGGLFLKKFVITFLLILNILFLFGCAGINGLNSKHTDFSRLDISDIKRVYIFSCGNRYRDSTKLAELTYDDVESLIALLNQVELTGNPTEEFQDSPGMYWEMYRIELYNGQEFDFAANKNYYVINMNGYVADESVGNEIFLQNREWCKKYFPEDY